MSEVKERRSVLECDQEVAVTVGGVISPCHRPHQGNPSTPVRCRCGADRLAALAQHAITAGHRGDFSITRCNYAAWAVDRRPLFAGIPACSPQVVRTGLDRMWSPTPPRCGDLRLTCPGAEVRGGRQHPTRGSWRVSAVCVGELGVDASVAPVWGRLGAFGGLFCPVMRSGGALAGWCGAVVWFSGAAKPTVLRRRLLSGGVVPC